MSGTATRLEKGMLAKAITKFTGILSVLTACFAVLVVTAAVSAAAEAPEWSNGFPRQVEQSALLQWNPVKGATEYRVYRTETEGKDLKLLSTVKPNRHIDKDLPAGRTLYYYITAVVDGKEGPRSEVKSVTTEKKKVFVPLKKPELSGAHIKTAETGNPSVGLRWEGGEGSELVGYNVYRSTRKGAGYTLVGSTGGDLYDDEDVKRGTTYYYVVTAVDSSFNETKYSNEVSAAIPVIEKAKAKEEVPPTKMRASKLLFTIPREDMTDEEKAKFPEIRNVQGVAVDEAVGHIYVANYGYGGVMVLDMNGSYQFGIRRDGANGKEKFGAATNVALGPNGNLYVTDYTSDILYEFDYQGRLRDTIKVDISHVPGFEKTPAVVYGVVVSHDGIVYVTVPRSNRVLGYNSRKEVVYEATEDPKKGITFVGPGNIIIDKDGDLVLIDGNHSSIQVIGTDGKFRRSFGKKGMGAGFLYYPVGLANGNDGEIFNSSGRSPNIQAFSTKGEFLYALSNEKFDGPPPVADMRGIWVDSQNRMYVADGLANKVVVLQLLDKYQTLVPEE